MNKNRIYWVFLLAILFVFPVGILYTAEKEMYVFVSIMAIAQTLSLIIFGAIGFFQMKWFRSADALEEEAEDLKKRKRAYIELTDFLQERAFSKNFATPSELAEVIRNANKNM